jgi:uncharacterized protein (DUF2132 family)
MLLFGIPHRGRFQARSNSSSLVEAVPMPNSHPNDPLHGVTLEKVLVALVDHYGWKELGEMIDIRCFQYDPSVKSSLTFLRKTPWARRKVEDLYLWMASSEQSR